MWVLGDWRRMLPEIVDAVALRKRVWRTSDEDEAGISFLPAF
jgi:hypothetical protein